MLNHARTLLMNVTCPSPQAMLYPGDELIAPGFRQLALPTYLNTVRARIYGAAPDRYMRNYRTRQLLALLHAGPLEEFVLALDRRVTYGFDDEALVGNGLFLPRVTAVAAAGPPLLVTGSPAAPDATGRMYHSFAVDVSGANTVGVTGRQPPHLASTVPYAVGDGGVSERIPLPGTGYGFRLRAGDANTSWLVEVLLRPQRDLGQIAADLEGVGEPVLLQLFGVGREEPYLTFRNLWFDQRETPLRLGGLVMALVYRTEERRLAAGS